MDLVRGGKGNLGLRKRRRGIGKSRKRWWYEKQEKEEET